MNKRRFAAGGAMIALALSAAPAHALFHLWDFTEFYSNVDGSVQFIEMRATSNGENVASAGQLRSASTGNVFQFPSNLMSSLTANKNLLVATTGFEALNGGVLPDFTLPASFFNPAGDTVSLTVNGFGTVDSRMFASVPTDGLMSLNYPSGTTATNSPTNFAGQAGQLQPPPTTIDGDFSGNGSVENADLTLLLNNWAAQVPPVPDGWIGTPQPTMPAVDNDELTVLLNNWGATVDDGIGSGLATETAVPEPAALGPIVVGALALLSRCRRWRA